MPSGFAAKDKRVPLKELVARVPDGACVAIGGSFLHRGLFAFVRELIRQCRSGLEIIQQSPGCGIVAMEGNFGLAPWNRRAAGPALRLPGLRRMRRQPADLLD